MTYYFLQRYEVMSASMEPTLQVGETYWALRLMQTPERGDIVSFLNPTASESGEVVIKRIIGLPGDNRDESFDSRSFGPVRSSDLQYIVKEKGEEWPVGMAAVDAGALGNS